jgi:hypothetical protein
MTSRIDMSAPASITVLGGTAAISPLTELPPGTISLTDPNAGGTVTVRLVTRNAAASLSAGSAGGASVSSNANTLSITGTAAQVNAALATLQITEASGATSDDIIITATDPGALSASTAIAVQVIPDTGPAFASPPSSFTLTPFAVNALPGLVIGDPQLTALDLAGQGGQESLAVTLAAASGVLLLPGFSLLDNISASGLGTGTIVLDFTADRLAAVNTLLAGLEFAGAAGTSALNYSLRYIAGPLPAASTNGNIGLDIEGSLGAAGTFKTADDTIIIGPVTQTASATLNVTGITADLGGINGVGAVNIAADSSLNLPGNNLTLGGTSLDFGTLGPDGLLETGALLVADSVTFGGVLSLGAGGLLDFTGDLVADANAAVVNQLAISLGQGAVLTGGGTITAGNFSESGRITGAGTILAASGETLLIAAGSIGGGAVLEVEAGGVMVLGPVAPLYGVFNDTPLTIDNSVILSFSGAPGATPITGAYADTLDQAGGVFVITGPQAFSGTINGFAPGDRLIFPDLQNIAIANSTASSFEIIGVDQNGNTVTYNLHAAVPQGDFIYAGTDSAGDPQLSVRQSSDVLFLNSQPVSQAQIGATAGIAQPLQGLSLLLTASTTLALTLTLSVGAGVLSEAGGAATNTLTLSTVGATAMNNLLSQISYTGTGIADVLTIASATGVLAGLLQTAQITPVAAGGNNGFTNVPSEGEVADFTAASTAPNTIAAAVGQISLSATQNFADALILDGIGGTALVIDNGAVGYFDAGASVAMSGNVIVGDASGAGTLAVVTDDFLVGAGGGVDNLTIGGVSAAAGSVAEIFGTAGVSGTIFVGAGTLALAGQLGAAATSLAAKGSLFAYGSAVAAFGSLTDAGAATLTGQVIASAAAMSLSGTLALCGGTTLTDAGPLQIGSGGDLVIGPDAFLLAGNVAMSGGTIAASGLLEASAITATAGLISLTGGTLEAGALTLAGGTLAGYGVVSGSLATAGTILAQGGLLTLGTDAASTGLIKIGASASLDAVHALSGTVTFSGTDAELIINDSAVFSATVLALSAHDVVDLVGVAPSLVSFGGHHITTKDTAGNTIGGFTLSLASGQPAISIVSDGFGGALVTAGGAMPCFARGSRLLTPNGYRPVETLKPGDALITAAGDRRAICWIGRRVMDFLPTRAEPALPVVISPGAFGPNRPLRPLRLSPLHAIYVDGVLVPVTHLVNGATIRRETGRAAVTYFHVELDRHNIILAEGLACETYLDAGNRGALYEESGVRAPPGKPFARLVTGGPKLAAIRRRLHEIALAQGFTLTYQPVLRAVAEGRTALPRISMASGRRVARFTLPAKTRAVTLLSRCASPADTNPESEDRRDLALCLAQAKAGRDILTPGDGWLSRAPADDGIWMGAAADLLLPRPADHLTLSLAAIIQTWRSPALDPAAGNQVKRPSLPSPCPA